MYTIRFVALLVLGISFFCTHADVASIVSEQDIVVLSDQHEDSNEIARSKEEEERIQHLAVETVTNMAYGIINIGKDPNNPEHVAREIAGILGNFANLVTQAMKHPSIALMLDDPEFREVIHRNVFASLHQE